MWSLFRKGRSAARRTPARQRRLGLDRLETRCVLSTASLVGDQLIVVGTPGDDVIEVRAYLEPEHQLQGAEIPLPTLRVSPFQSNDVVWVDAVSDSDVAVGFPPSAASPVVPVLPAPYATVTANGKEIGRFDLSAFDGIQIYGEDGDDRLSVSDALKTHVYLDGGAGDDVLFVDPYKVSADDPVRWLYPPTTRSIMLGGDGDDLLVGSDGVDMLIGGLGQDSLIGLGGDDLLIGGATFADDDAKMLFSLFAVWTSNETYPDRIEMFLNAVSALIPADMDATFVYYDGSVDYLEGGDGQDWFFAGDNGKIADRTRGEIVAW